MADKKYEVIVDKFVGKHGVYKKGAIIVESEIMGGEAGKKLALEGQKGQTRKYRDEKEARKLKDVAPTLKAISGTKKATK